VDLLVQSMGIEQTLEENDLGADDHRDRYSSQGDELSSQDFDRLPTSPRPPGGETRRGPLVPAPAEHSLSQARDQFGLAFDMAATGMAVMSLDGRFIRVNGALCELLGRSEKELLATSWQAVAHPEDLDVALGFIRTAMSGGSTTVKTEMRYLRSDGDVLCSLVGASLITDDRGRALFFFAQLHDVTENKKIEGELDEKTSWVKLLQAVAVSAGAASSFEDAIRAALDEVCLQTGWDIGHIYRVEADGTLAPTNIWHIEDSRRFQPFKEATEKTALPPGTGLLGRVVSTGGPIWVNELRDDENFIRAASAEVVGLHAAIAFPVLLEASVVAIMEFFTKEKLELDPALLEVMEHIGTLLGQSGEHRLIEEALVQNEERTRQIIETASDAFVEMDREGRITDWNRKAMESFGWSRQEVLNKPVADTIIPERYREAHWNGLKNFLATGSGPVIGQRIEISALKRSGEELPVELTIWTTKVGDEVRFNAFIHDITERKNSEEAVREANENLKRWIHELEQRNKEISTLNEMGEMLQSCKSSDEAHDVVAQFGERIFGGNCGALNIISESHNLVQQVATWGPEGVGVRMFSPDECWALRRGRTHSVANPEAALLCAHLEGTGPNPYMCVPMMAQGETLGILHVQDRGARDDGSTPLADSLRQLVTTVSEQVSMSLANFRLLESREDLRFQSIRDPLTGLFNRRYMEESLDRELRRAARNEHPLGIIMLDIDHFKEVNDNFGHEAGDAVLRALGAFLAKRIRGEDIACRFGGEEFMLILPEAPLDVTRERAEALWHESKGIEVEFGGERLRTPTISFGVAVFPEHGGTREAVLRAADSALYRAKSEGRDRVVSAPVR
jgi:diguanylate cyclase (GGDEF)-like protein/PAS domain S-box-containing protein